MTVSAYRREMSEERNRKMDEDLSMWERLLAFTSNPIRDIGSCNSRAGFDL